MKKIISIIFIILTTTLIIFSQINIVYSSNSTNNYTQNKNFIRASHILVNSETQATRIRNEIETGAISFENAALKYSSCPSGKNGGDLNYFSRNQMVKEFEDAAFSLPIGAISKPIKTQFGYHLIKVTAIK